MARPLTFEALGWCIAAFAAVNGLAADHHGQVTFGGLPVPGAAVSVAQGDKRLFAITDQQGAYSFPGLADGNWTIQVEMLCFSPVKQEIAVAPDAPSPVWELKLLSFDEIKASAPAPGPSAAVTSSVNAQGAAELRAAGQASDGAPAKPDKTRVTKRGPRAPKTGGPALAANAGTAFQRTDVNASADPAAAASDNGAPAAGETNQTASEAFVVNGSLSNGVERRAIGNARKGPGSMFRGDLSLILDN